jgi:tRNA(Ile2)-agmatinylcytidine synthase
VQSSILTEFHIGIDDTDSEKGGCTTYTATVLFQELFSRGFKPFDFPWLVRLNPNIPWKTRGNGALSIHFFVDEKQIEEVQRITMETVEKTTVASASGTDPAVAFLKGQVPRTLREYSTRALHDVLSVPEARAVARRAGAEVHVLMGVRGVIGSLAAIGAGLDSVEHTFEIIAYRIKENLGSPRRIDRESVKVMNAKHDAGTFNNLDPESGRVLVSPHGLDPVLLGIRGYSPHDILRAFKEVQLYEEIERVMIFRTNQGTDAHLRKRRRAVDLKPHQSGAVTGRVEDMPRVLRGGHVVFGLKDDSGLIDCAVYRPTGSLAMAARDLLPGDRVRACGGIRGWRRGRPTLNVEKLEVLHMVEKIENVNPLCSNCGGRCESMGRGQGLRCKKCRQRNETASRIQVRQLRHLRPTVYIPPPRSRRHLTKPDSRRGNIFQYVPRVEEFQLCVEDYN